MKKYLLVLFAITLIHPSYSQTQKGKMFIGGQFNLSGGSSSSSDTLYKSDNNSFGLTISPNFGYFIKDNFAIGLNMSFGYSNYSRNYDYYSNQTLYTSIYETNRLCSGLSGFARYYIRLADNFMLYANGEVGDFYNTNKVKQINNNSNGYNWVSSQGTNDYQDNNIGLSVSSGLIYFITPKLGLQTSFGSVFYNYSTSSVKTLNNNNRNSSSSYGIDLNITSLRVGINYYF